MPNTYTITNDVRDGVSVSLTVSGQASLDEMLDAMRGFMVACSYHPHTAARLQLVEPDGDESH